MKDARYEGLEGSSNDRRQSQYDVSHKRVHSPVETDVNRRLGILDSPQGELFLRRGDVRNIAGRTKSLESKAVVEALAVVHGDPSGVDVENRLLRRFLASCGEQMRDVRVVLGHVTRSRGQLTVKFLPFREPPFAGRVSLSDDLDEIVVDRCVSFGLRSELVEVL